jgi:hypothetical protein
MCMFRMCSPLLARARTVTEDPCDMEAIECKEAALNIIESWGWDHADPRFDFKVPVMISLSEAINRLAMEGHVDAPGAVLSLLAGGELVATGSYRWKKFHGDEFSRDSIGPIPAARWQALREACLSDNCGKKQVTLHLLNEGWTETKQPRAEWTWARDRFSTTEAGGGLWLDEGYFEEMFSAADIELRPAPRQTREVEAQLKAHPKTGGAPAKYDWERAVAAIAFQWAEEGSWQPITQSEVKERLAAWFAERDEYPSDSMLKERARWLFAEFRRRAQEVDNLAA